MEGDTEYQEAGQRWQVNKVVGVIIQNQTKTLPQVNRNDILSPSFSGKPPMMTLEKFNEIKDKYGYHASWAVWAGEGERPKSNIGDLTVLDPEKNPDLLSLLNPNVVFVGLNISIEGAIETPLANFHSSYYAATDYKIRYAFKVSPFWGGYMTDIIKDFGEMVSSNVRKYLRENKEFELQNIESFRRELFDIGASNPTLIAFGNDTFNVLLRNLTNEFKILKVPHYAHYMSKENYRAKVRSICGF